MINADVAFANAANAAAAAFAATPPFIAYRVTLRTTENGVAKIEDDKVVVRTADGKALVGEGNLAKVQADPPGLPPSIDALGNWSFSPVTRDGHLVLHVNFHQLRSYALASPAPNVDAVAFAIKGFAISYVGDGGDHVRLEPATQEMRVLAREHNRFLYRDVWFDPATWLPTRVVVTAPNGALSIEYAQSAGHWLLSHVVYDSTEQTRRATTHTTIDVTYNQYSFSESF